MNLSRLKQIDEWSWTVPPAPGEARGEVKLYGSRELLATMDDKVIEQITNVARLPGLVGPAMTMPPANTKNASVALIVVSMIIVSL